MTYLSKGFWVILIFIFNIATAQPNIDSSGVSFIYQADNVAKHYRIGVVNSNQSQTALKCYSDFVFYCVRELYTNAYIQLEMKQGGSFVPIECWFSANFGPIYELHPYLNYDLERKILLPGQYDTLWLESQSFNNKLFGMGAGDPTVTQLRFKLHWRIDFKYPGPSPDPGKDKHDAKEIIYKTSDWFYFEKAF